MTESGTCEVGELRFGANFSVDPSDPDTIQVSAGPEVVAKMELVSSE